jgi:hypothetical protein
MVHMGSGENCKTYKQNTMQKEHPLQCDVTWPSDGAKSGVHEHWRRVENRRAKQTVEAAITLDLPLVSVLLRSVDLFDSSFLLLYVGNCSF